MQEDYLREFRGYLDGELRHTFPLHWVDKMYPSGNGKICVEYLDEMNYNTETEECPVKIIVVDKIDIK